MKALAGPHWQFRMKHLPSHDSHMLEQGIFALIAFNPPTTTFFSALSTLLASPDFSPMSQLILVQCLLPPIIKSQQTYRKSAFDLLAIMIRQHGNSPRFVSAVSLTIERMGARDVAMLFIPALLSAARKAEVPTSKARLYAMDGLAEKWSDQFGRLEHCGPADTERNVLDRTSSSLDRLAASFEIQLKHEDTPDSKTWKMFEKEIPCFECGATAQTRCSG